MHNCTEKCNENNHDYALDKIKSEQWWDFIFITAANDSQAESMRKQIDIRFKNNCIPLSCTVEIVPDIKGKRVGSGIATLNVLQFIKSKYCNNNFFNENKCLLINSGGENSRTPTCAVCSKLFMPYLTDKECCQTLFDKMLNESLHIIPHIFPGLFIMACDVLPDFCSSSSVVFPAKREAFAITCLKNISDGVNHGVYIADENGYAKSFFHKQTMKFLNDVKAADSNGLVNVDTGCLFFTKEIIDSLLGLASADNGYFISGEICLNLYGDMVFPFIYDADYSVYKAMPTEKNQRNIEKYRKIVFDCLSVFKIKVVNFGKAGFIHLGTQREIVDYFFNTQHGKTNEPYICVCSAAEDESSIGESSYVEYSFIGKNVTIGKHCVISHSVIENIDIPDNLGIYTQKLTDGNYIAYCYDFNSESIQTIEFPIKNTRPDAVKASVEKYISQCEYDCDTVKNTDILKYADFESVFSFRDEMRVKSEAYMYCNRICKKEPFSSIRIEESSGIPKEKLISEIHSCSVSLSFSSRIRVLAWLSYFCNEFAKELFDCVKNEALTNCANVSPLKIKKDFVSVSLPLRINWGGGWSDTPPYCYEKGGAVLNCAVKVNGICPVNVTVKRLKEPEIVFLCADDKTRFTVNASEDIFNCSSETDCFSLHKATLISFGIISSDNPETINEIIERLGGGFCLSTAAYGIPRGSGLGTSSILLTACMKALSDFFGINTSDQDVYNMVILAEQLMNTGGGWQDSVGGFVNGIKLITSEPGVCQKLSVSVIDVPLDTMAELSERFCLIYTGKKRLARNILKRVVIKYLSGEKDTVRAYEQTKKIAFDMCKALKEGSVDVFAQLMNEQWQNSCIIDESCNVKDISDIIYTCEDLLSGKMICGAGGGGFIQVILKRGFTKADLCNRLNSVFSHDGIHCMDIELV